MGRCAEAGLPFGAFCDAILGAVRATIRYRSALQPRARENALSHDERLLDIICCPVTHSPLARMSADELERLNALIAEAKISNRGDEVVTEALQDALVTRDGKLAYPIRDGIPILLGEEGISMAQLDAQQSS